MTLLSNGIILALETKADLKFVERMRRRVLHKQERMNPTLKKFIVAGKVSGVLISASAVGALTAAFLIHTLGYKRPHNYFLATAGSILFVATWVSIYSGVIIAIKQIMAMI